MEVVGEASASPVAAAERLLSQNMSKRCFTLSAKKAMQETNSLHGQSKGDKQG